MRLDEKALRPLLLNPTLSEAQFKKEIELISKRFTTDRKSIGRYVLSVDSVSSYTLFYLPTNLLKLKFLFSLLPNDLTKNILQGQFIDYGAGPGTYGLAFLFEALEREVTPGPLFLVDSSKLMRDQSSKILEGFFPNVVVKISDRYEKMGEKSRTLLFGNSLNEMNDEEFFKVLETVDPDYLILIEPGTKEQFVRIQKIRERLIKDGRVVLYPCVSNQKCPMDPMSNWCHQVLFTTHDPSIERLSQLVGLDRKSMPMIIHLYVKEGHPLKDKTIIRIYPETKFSFEFEVCDSELIKIQLMKKDYSKARLKEISNFSVGEKISYQTIKELGKNYVRAKLV